MQKERHLFISLLLDGDKRLKLFGLLVAPLHIAHRGWCFIKQVQNHQIVSGVCHLQELNRKPTGMKRGGKVEAKMMTQDCG